MMTSLTKDRMRRIQKILEHCAFSTPSQRQFGKTTAAANLTKRVDGILLTFNVRSAKHAAMDHDITTASLESWRPEGNSRPVIIDQDALVFFTLDCIAEISRLNEKLDQVEAIMP